VTRRGVRLLVLLGLAVAAYLVLVLFDGAARADDGPAGQLGISDQVDSVKETANSVTKVIRDAAPEIPRPAAPKVHTPKVHTPKVQRPTVRVPEARPRKAPASRKISSSAVRGHETVQRLRTKTTKLSRPTAEVAQTTARQALSKLPALSKPPALSELPALSKPPALSELPALSKPPALSKLPVLPKLPLLPELSALPQVPQVPALPELSALPEPSAVPELPALPQVGRSAQPQLPAISPPPVLPQPGKPAPIRALASPGTAVPAYPFPRSFTAATDLSGMAKSPAAQVQARPAPLPAPPRQPADRSTPTGQARDSGGGSAPMMGTLSSSWRPEVAATGRHLATDLLARGRTIRQAGPPS
jgi:hypothetical protein